MEPGTTRTLLGCLCLGLALAGPGCSTMRNVGVTAALVEGESPGPKEPFGGVRESSQAVANGVQSFRTANQHFYVPVLTECVAVAILLDVPLSLAGDLLTLPYCLYHAHVAALHKPTGSPAASNGTTPPVPIP